MPDTLRVSPLALGLGIFSAVFISHIAEKSLKSHDDPRIVIDEWIGIWIALWGWPAVLGPYQILAFVFFRLFDVFKGPWGRALQKLPGGFGVTMDDVFAGLLANTVTRLLFFLWS